MKLVKAASNKIRGRLKLNAIPVKSSRCQSFDGMRAIAVLAVLAVHAGVPGFEAGWLGVDLFFVLSGFLITTILRREYRATGGIRLRRFYFRRFLRLMPPYYLYVGLLSIYFAVGFGWREAHGGWETSTYILSLWMYFVNYLPKGGIWEHQFLSLHLWSLAVEEQFYFIWPVAMLFMGKLPRYFLSISCLVGIQILYVYLISGNSAVAHGLDGRGVGITIGCWFAVLNERLGRDKEYKLLSGGGAAILIVMLFGLSFWLDHIQTPQVTIKRWIVVPFAICCGVFATAGWRDELPKMINRILSWNILAYIGVISYGVYLYHLLVHTAIWAIPVETSSGVLSGLVYGLRLLLYIGLSIALAAFSFSFIERPFLRLKDRSR